MPEARSSGRTTKKTATRRTTKKTTTKKPVARKSAAKKTTKRAITTAKPVAKKVGTTTTKKAAKKRSVATKKAATLAVSRKTAVGSKKKAATKKRVEEPVVVLPTKMSIRAREKALVLAEKFEYKLHAPAYALTMTFGMLFVCLGGYVGIQELHGVHTCADGQCQAQVISSDESTEEIVSIDLTPQVTLMQDIPPMLSESLSIPVDTEFVDELSAYVDFINEDGIGSRESLQVTYLRNDKFRIGIPGDELPPNQYVLFTVAANNADTQPQIISHGSFIVPVPEEPEEQETVTPSTVTESQTETAEDYSGVSVEQSTTTSSSRPALLDREGLVDTNLPGEATQIDIQGDDQSSDDEMVQLSEAQDEEISEIRIQAESILSGRAIVLLDSNVTGFVTLYARRLQGTERQLMTRVLGTATQININTRDLPNGDYEFFALANQFQDEVRSNSLQIRIENETVALETDTVTVSTEQIQERDTFEVAPALQFEPVPNAEDRANEPETQPVSESDEGAGEENPDPVLVDRKEERTLEAPIRERALKRLQEDETTLDDLFRKYGVAVQSGDQDLIRVSKKQIEAFKQRVVEDALTDDDERFIADDLSDSLERELGQLTQKVETFENLRRERLEGSASVDTDGDGISDTDETLLFKTDPLRADTDGDGFTDGVEIIKGFDPKDSASEALITYRSPKETVGIAPNENLKVDSVVPDVQVAEEEVAVQAVVRGRGLPNSFVTLYVFSTPTIVTVKTEADGTFEYTFSKELEDGEHQVFVALTDNTGDIVAQSEPFTFVKRAEAFTAVEAEAVVSDLQPSQLMGEPASPYRTVLSMSVLALGVLLILLGIGLRSNRPEEQYVETAV